MSETSSKKKGKTGPKPRIFTEDERKKALEMYSRGCSIDQVRQFLQCSEEVLIKNIPRDDFRRAKQIAMGRLHNVAYEKALAGDNTMLIFILKTQGRMSELPYEYKLKLKYEKELLKYKQEMGIVDDDIRPIQIVISDRQTPDYDRNAIDTDCSPVLGLPDTE